jgi:hypothetical protein
LISCDLQLGGDAVVSGVEESVGERGAAFDAPFEGGVGE